MDEKIRGLLNALPQYAVQFIEQSFAEAHQIMIGGSYAKGLNNAGSDVDLLVIFPKINYTIRNVVQFQEGWIDLAVHDYASIECALRSEQELSVCALADDIRAGVYIKPTTADCLRLKKLASEIIKEGPGPFDFDGLRNHLLGLSSDLQYLTMQSERLAVIMSICHKLMIFAARAGGGWVGSGKYLGRDLQSLSPHLANKLGDAASQALAGDHGLLISMVRATIERHYGEVSMNLYRKRPVKAHIN